MPRTGDEPIHARSALKLRAALAVFGLVLALAALVGFAAIGAYAWDIPFGVLAMIALVDLAVVMMRIRQGPHYQPGPDIPPYRAVTPSRPRDERTPRDVAPRARRQARYFVLVGACLVLLVLAWAWVRLYSTSAAVGMTVAAMVLMAIAAVAANAGSPINRR